MSLSVSPVLVSPSVWMTLHSRLCLCRRLFNEKTPSMVYVPVRLMIEVLGTKILIKSFFKLYFH